MALHIDTHSGKLSKYFHDHYHDGLLKKAMEDQSQQKIIFDGITFLNYKHFNSLNSGKIDFSNINFGNNSLIFRSCDFADFELNLSNSTFDKADLILENCQILAATVNCSGLIVNSGKKNISINGNANSEILFTGASLGSGDVVISITKRYDGTLDFSNAKISDGLFELTCAEQNSAEFIFTGCKFRNGDATFKNMNIANGKLDFQAHGLGVVILIFRR